MSKAITDLSMHLPVSKNWKMTVAIIFIAQMCSAIGFSIVFPFLPLYVQALGSTTGLSTEFLAGMVIASQGFTMMLAGPVWGVIADHFGRKKMVLRAMYGGTIIMLLMALVQSAEQLVLLRAIQGFITGTVSANNALVAAETPRHRIGLAMGTIQVGQWGGIALGPLIGGVMADWFGYGIPFVVTAILLLISGILVSFGIHENFERDENMPAIGPANMIAEWRHVFATQGVSLVFFMQFLSSFARSIIIPIAPLFVVSLLVDTEATSNTYAGLVLAVSSFTSTFGAVYLGRLGDRISHRSVLLGCAIVSAVFYIPQIFVADIWQLVALQAITGIAAGGIIAAPSALLARYTQHGEEGTVYGIDNSVNAGARAVAPLGGALVAMVFGLRGTFAATGLVFILIALVTWYCLPKDSIEAVPA